MKRKTTGVKKKGHAVGGRQSKHITTAPPFEMLSVWKRKRLPTELHSQPNQMTHLPLQAYLLMHLKVCIYFLRVGVVKQNTLFCFCVPTRMQQETLNLPCIGTAVFNSICGPLGFL